jgi:hypothetical protein
MGAAPAVAAPPAPAPLGKPPPGASLTVQAPSVPKANSIEVEIKANNCGRILPTQQAKLVPSPVVLKLRSIT